jgi:hypothetical protein
MATLGSQLNVTSGLALARAAEAMLRALGGCEVVLRFRGAAISDDAGSNPRLGLGTKISEDVTLSPVIVRSAAEDSFEFVIAGSTVDRQVELRQTGTAKALFDSALGFVKDGKLLRVAGVSTDLHSGAAYLYRVTGRE